MTLHELRTRLPTVRPSDLLVAPDGDRWRQLSYWLPRLASHTHLARALRSTRDELGRVQRALQASLAREALARHQAWHDPLTGLPNRRGFEARSSDALAESPACEQAYAVLFIDLDDFKTINDRHGHAIGDELLRTIGQRLASTVRSGDLVSRQGGDEFLCLLRDVRSIEQVRPIAHKLFDAVIAPCHLGGQVLLIHPSIGMALYPQDGTNLAELIARADSAMFRAKRRPIGKGFVLGIA